MKVGILLAWILFKALCGALAFADTSAPSNSCQSRFGLDDTMIELCLSCQKQSGYLLTNGECVSDAHGCRAQHANDAQGVALCECKATKGPTFTLVSVGPGKVECRDDSSGCFARFRGFKKLIEECECEAKSKLGFYWSGGTCVEDKTGCELKFASAPAKAAACRSCENPASFIITGRCRADYSGCFKAHATNPNVALECNCKTVESAQAGYFWKDGQCVKDETNCTTKYPSSPEKAKACRECASPIAFLHTGACVTDPYGCHERNADSPLAAMKCECDRFEKRRLGYFWTGEACALDATKCTLKFAEHPRLAEACRDCRFTDSFLRTGKCLELQAVTIPTKKIVQSR